MKQGKNNLVLFKQYLSLIKSHFDQLETSYDKCNGSHLSILCKEAIDNHEKYPSDKLYRWLGFVEGVLANSNIIRFNDNLNPDFSNSKALTAKEIEVNKIIFNRYLNILEKHCETFDSKSNIKFLEIKNICQQLIDNMNFYTLDKISNTLGFIQGVLAINGIISVDKERDFTRPLLHSLHKNKIPSFG